MTTPPRLTAALADRYRIERELGQGGMATVYLARDLKHDREVALKVLRQDVAAVLGAERFLNEIRIAARLDHPHLLTLIDSGEADGFLYYVLPFVRGESLRDRLKHEKQLGLDEALVIARQIGGALDYAHRQNVVHRDIKPENILLQEGEAMLADFGIALAVKEAGGSRLTETGLPIGTPQYMSPEQAAGDRQLDARSDIYSLATVVYEMLAGEPPFMGASVQTVVARLLAERPTPLVTLRPDLPSGVDAAIQRALSKVPADRFATAGQFVEALTSRAVGGPAAPRSAQRVATIGLTVAILVLGTLWAIRRRSPSLDGASPAPLRERHLTQASFLAGVEEWPAWSPDGRYLVYAAESGGFKKLFIRRLEASTERQLTTGPADDIQPAWSPDGRHIAFVRASLPGGKLEPSDVLGWYGEEADIWVIDAEGGGEARLIAKAVSPSWSPDGKRLAFDAALAGPRRIWVTDAGGANPQQLTTDSSEAVVHTSPRWSPDGSRIVFRRIEKAKSDIMVVHVASKATSSVTDDNVIDVNPDWSRSGRFIIYSSARGGGLNLWRVRVAPDGRSTGPPQQLTNGAGDDLELSVAPVGNRLAFSVLGINSDIWRLPVDPATGRGPRAPGGGGGTTPVDSPGAGGPGGRIKASK
jgi:serine/threonine-protein kinase